MFKKLSQLFGSLGIIAIGAILGSIGGQGPKWLRRFVYPAILTLYAISIVHNWWVLSIFTMSIWLSIGYGLVSPDDLKPSILGKIAYKLFPKSQLWQNVFARGIVGILISLSILSVPILTHHWLSYAIGSWIIIGIWGSVSWRGFGETKVKLFGKEISLLNVDLITYGVTTLGFLVIIHGFFK